MEKFIKKHNLGLLFAIIVFTGAILFSIYQTANNKSLNNKADKILTDYSEKMDEATLSINVENSKSKEDEILKLIDEYWEDVDSKCKAFDDKNATYITKSKFVKSIKNAMEKTLLTDLTMAKTTLSCSDAYAYKNKYFDVACSYDSRYMYDENTKNDVNNSTKITLSGLVGDGLSHEDNVTYVFKKVKGSWKIIGIKLSTNLQGVNY